ncbi:MAG: hypothetical protein K2N73_17250 [Lachnospiraceae bacterium]|nr:hypothetical protein [Lachnospiraceae bacterium]
MFAQKMEKKTAGAENRAILRKMKKSNVPQLPWLGDQMAERQKYIWNNDRKNDSTEHIWNSTGVIQRSVVRFKPNEIKEKGEQEFEEKAGVLDSYVQTAYNELLAGNFAGASDNYIKTYIIRKRNYENGSGNGKSTIHPSTAAGYVIENKVSNRIKNLPGLTLQNTGILEGTRPDIVLDSESTPGKKALMDITASKSVGHILLKKGNWLNHNNIIYVAELVYPSIDFETMAPITLTDEQEEQIRQHAMLRQEELQERQDWYRDNLVENQSRICHALNGFYISAKNATFRQLNTIRSNFMIFGITISFEGEDKIIRATDISSNIVWDNYSPFNMNRMAKQIIDGIERGDLVQKAALR